MFSEKIDSRHRSVKDRRGGKRQRREPHWKEKIMEYIKSIPAQESYYSRNDAPNRNISQQNLVWSNYTKGF